MLGDKSTFSITPFLNRTTSVAPETPDEQHEQPAKPAEEAASNDIAEAEPTPTAPPKKALKKSVAPKPKALAPAASKANAKPRAGPARKKAAPSLEVVAEETPGADASQEKENIAPAGIKVPLGGEPKSKPKSLQPRKSLHDFASFNKEPAPEKKKKNRKQLGDSTLLGRTLFDEIEDDEAKPTKPLPGRGLFAARALGKSLGAKGGLKGPLMVAEDGFQFSPLKKDRKKGAAA